MQLVIYSVSTARRRACATLILQVLIRDLIQTSNVTKPQARGLRQTLIHPDRTHPSPLPGARLMIISVKRAIIAEAITCAPGKHSWQD